MEGACHVGVNAVRDRADGAGVADVLPHLARGLAVQLRDRVGRARQPQPGHRHVERVAADRTHLGTRELQAGAHAAQVGERVLLVAGLHRGVRGEHGLLAHAGPRVGELQSRFHEFGDALEAREHRVTLVEVVGVHLQPQPAERAHATDAQHHLLRDARVGAGLVEAVRDPAVLLLDGLEQVERDVAVAVGHPHAQRHLAAADAHAHADLRVLEERGVEPRVLLVRSAIGPDALHAVAALVQQAHGHHGGAQVVRGLDVVPGQDAEAAGVDGERFVEAVLHAEVGDDGRARAGGGGRSHGVLIL
jgi:hypothetical protein